ncbi:MAG: hypothetical protein RL333_1231 [Pseudomonadota bacterium]|jgi:hypothetical protein
MKRFLVIGLLTFTLPVYADPSETVQGATIPLDQPDLPAPVESGKPLDPDVTIIRKGDEMIEEHRENGQVYMIKVNPSIGLPYSWVDMDRDGTLDSMHNDNTRGMNINRWTLFSW